MNCSNPVRDQCSSLSLAAHQWLRGSWAAGTQMDGSCWPCAGRGTGREEYELPEKLICRKREHTMLTRETKWAHNLESGTTTQSLGLFLVDPVATAPQKWVTINSLMGRHEANPALGTAQNLTPDLSITCIPASADQELSTPCCFYYLLLPPSPSLCTFTAAIHLAGSQWQGLSAAMPVKSTSQKHRLVEL